MRAARGPVDWLTFPSPTDPEHQYRVNVSFMLSTYRCIFGQGCPGMLNNGGPASDLGCCSRGVTFIDEADFEHVSEMVERLTEEDSDNIEHIRASGWYLRSKGGKPYKTRKRNHACIFDNRVGGPTGKPGCAFHHLALREGLHPADTKPFICWSVPLNFSAEAPEEPGGVTTTIVSAFTADAWGGTDDEEEPDGRGHVGYWCIETPDAYSGTQPAYVTMEHELRKGMGDEAYEVMARLLEQIERPRYPMPGQLRNGGRPMIPRLIERRLRLAE